MCKSNEYNERVSFVKINILRMRKTKSTFHNLCGVDYIERTCTCTCIYVPATSDYACHVADTTSTTSTSDEGTSKEAIIAVEEVE